jgi:hypothetical protein
MARIREALIAFGKNRQADIGTASLAAACWRLNKLNTDFSGARLNT